MSKRPKSIKPKHWKLLLEVNEMNHRIIKDRMKNSLYVPGPFDEMLLDSGEYKANRKKKKK